jgi:hypothetical protein
MRKHLFSAMIAGAALVLSAGTAAAAAINLNQWYTGKFGSIIPSAVSGPSFAPGVNGPLYGGGVANSIDAPAGTSWTVTLSGPGLLTVTDLEVSGDEFQVFVNGVAATVATAWVGQNGLPGGFTSTSCFGCSSVGSDISAALGNADFSSGTFLLFAGLNTINIDYIGRVSNGDVAFYAVAAVPEPSTWAMMIIGFAGLGFAAYRRRRTVAA